MRQTGGASVLALQPACCISRGSGSAAMRLPLSGAARECPSSRPLPCSGQQSTPAAPPRWGGPGPAARQSPAEWGGDGQLWVNRRAGVRESAVCGCIANTRPCCSSCAAIQSLPSAPHPYSPASAHFHHALTARHRAVVIAAPRLWQRDDLACKLLPGLPVRRHSYRGVAWFAGNK